MLSYTRANSIFDGLITNLLSVLCILIEAFSPARAQGEKAFNNLKFGTFIGRFSNEDAASMAVNGLIWSCCLKPPEVILSD